jgi:hypothetical protein
MPIPSDLSHADNPPDTNFEQVTSPDDRGRVVQISHAALSGETIINWTRSLDSLQEELEHEDDGVGAKAQVVGDKS